MQNAYLELKLSWALFDKPPEALEQAESARLAQAAARQSAIEKKVLASREAANVMVPAATLATRIGEIRSRYPDTDDFTQDMARIGLTEESLAQAVEQDLRLEALLEKVAANVAEVSAVDAEIYYRLHPEAFNRPECRRLRHILITYDNSNEKAKAIARLESLRSTAENAEKFAQAALRYSQCPTAMSGGELGVVKRQQLYPELEAAAFALRTGTISRVTESPIGLHILRCDEILPSGMLPFRQVEAKIIERLETQRRKEAQLSWIKAL